jgi:hypothetical protein
VQFAGNAALGEERLDQVLRAVGGAGVADHPAGDVVGNRAQAAQQDAAFVAHDHVQADQRTVLA